MAWSTEFQMGEQYEIKWKRQQGPPGRRVVHIETSVIVQAKDMGPWSRAVAMRTERRLKGTETKCQTRPSLQRRRGKSRWF